MDQKPLVSEEIDAGARFVDQFGRFMPVRSAFWLRPREESDWALYIASDQVNEKTYDQGYGEVLRLAQELDDPNLDPFRVRLVPANLPMAEAATRINQRFPGRAATRFQGEEFGGDHVNGLYIYPAPVRTP